MQSCVVFKVLTVVEVAADIVITWLAGAAVFRVFREHRGVHAVWLEVETLRLNLCEISATQPMQRTFGD